MSRTNKKNFDYYFEFQGETCRQVPRGYEWKVIVDPTRNAEEPGCFYGRLFRMMDIRVDRDEKPTWPNGIVFEHIYSRRRLSYQKGLLLDLSDSRVIGKKPRIRNRYSKSDSIKKVNE